MVCQGLKTGIESGIVAVSGGKRFDASKLVAEGELQISRTGHSIADRIQGPVAPNVRTWLIGPPEGVKTSHEKNWWRRGLRCQSDAVIPQENPRLRVVAASSPVASRGYVAVLLSWNNGRRKTVLVFFDVIMGRIEAIFSYGFTFQYYSTQYINTYQTR